MGPMRQALAFCLLVLTFAPLASQADPPIGMEPSRPLTPRGLDNLVAFTRMLGYVRHFHPSDQAAAADWDRLALAGVQAVEDAAGPAELARALEAIFHPVAPTVRVFLTGSTPPPLPEALVRPGSPSTVVAWEHHGYPTKMDPGFRSERVTSPPRQGLPDPGQPFRADLGAGVSALVPLALYKDEKGTLPHPATAAPLPVLNKPEGFVPSGDDRTTRLAGVALAWNVLQHFYPYFDVAQTDWPEALRTTLTAAATDADEQAFHSTLRRMMARLRDGHANAWHRSEDWSGRLPLLWEWIEDRLVVTHVAPEGAGGIRRGDVVLRIDGRPAAEVVAAQEELVSGGTPGYRRIGTVFMMALGPKDSEMQLEVRHASGETETVAVRRTLPFAGPASLPEPRPEKMAELRPGIFYIDLDRVTDEDFRAALDRLATARGILFDVRGYPAVSRSMLGYLTDRPLAAAPSFIPLITRPDREQMGAEPWNAEPVEPAAPRLRARAAFLTDGRAVSWAETFLEYVEHYRLGEIVGSTTAGTTGNMSGFQIPGGYRLFWTCLKGQKHDGSPFNGVGVRPTVAANRTVRGVQEGRDEVLEKALEVVDSTAAVAR